MTDDDKSVAASELEDEERSELAALRQENGELRLAVRSAEPRLRNVRH